MGCLQKIPIHIRDILEYHCVSLNNIKLAAMADLTCDNEYRDVWLIVDNDTLFLLSGTKEEHNVKHFSDLRISTDSSNKANWHQKSFDAYELDKVEKIVIENLVSTGMLTATIGDEDIVLCCFSSSYAKEMGSFVKLFEKIKKGEKPTDKDFKDDSEPSYCPKCGLMYPDQDRRICPKCMDKRSVFMRVLSYIPRYKTQTVLIMLLMVINVGMNLVNPYLAGSILFDKVLVPGSSNYGQIGLIVMLMILSKAAAQITGIFHGRINAKLSAKVVFDIKTEIFDAMQRLSISFYNKRQTGNLMTRVNGDAENLQYFFIEGFPFLIVNFAMIIGISAIMLVMNWKLALLVLLPAPLILYYMKKMRPKLLALYQRRYRNNSKLNSLINDNLKGMRVVKAFGKESEEVKRFYGVSKGVYSVDMGLGTYTNTMFPVLWFIMGIGWLLVWGFGGLQVVNGALSFGTLMTFIGYIDMLYGPLQYVSQIVDWWSNCMNAAQRMFEIIDAVPEVNESLNAKSIPHINGNLELKHVSFSYEPNNPVLKDVSFNINAGEVLGIVGRSGAGKSTIVNLISRLYDVNEGSISIDGVNIKDVAIKDLKKQIGMVSQESYLFMGSIAENIAYAKPDATMEEIISAAKAANAHDFIMKFPDGYDTLIGKSGRDLSGGEKQRISIARAILHNPRILILDEATASVDTETEYLIQEALEKLIKGRTAISIAHRLSTLRNADKLIVVDNGSIVESGTHNELIRKKGKYYEMVQKQSEALKLKGVGD